MCGIVGFSGPNHSELLSRMNNALVHRGPDDFGTYEEVDHISLGHRRLSIIDLKTGHQPIFNQNKTIGVVYNGEIYNFLELRQELEKKGYQFQTHTDTEVIVHAFEEYGVESFSKFNGMFAFALWNKTTQELYLVRDRFGIKPLYYGVLKNQIFFASELKALLQNKDFSRELNPPSIVRYFTYRYIPGRETIYKNIYKLLPGQYLKFRRGDFTLHSYWDLLNCSLKHLDESSHFQEAFESIFLDAVKKCLISDVPVGLFLSGGVDSTLLAAGMKHLRHKPIKTFSIGFDLPTDELSEAKQVAQFLGTDHHEFKLEAKDLECLPQALYHLDEPNADSIVIPLYVLSQKASEFVKVVLSGEGADEIFGGYFFQKQLLKLNNLSQITPEFLMSWMSSLVGHIPVSLLDHFFEYSDSLGLEGRKRLQMLMANGADPFKSYQTVTHLFNTEERQNLFSRDFLKTTEGSQDTIEQDLRNISLSSKQSFEDRLILREMRYWLPDYILTRQDKLSMAHSLETRVPYLDHRLFEFLMTLPIALKRGNIRQKALLRKTLDRLFPNHPLLKSKKKKAFYLPFQGKFEKPFQKWVGDYLNSNRLKSEGLFNIDFVNQLKQKSNSSPLLYQKQLMSLIMWEMWREKATPR